jgi:hypothetical protein
MPKALGGYDIVKVPDKEEYMCDGCGQLMHGLGHYFDTAREGKSDIMWSMRYRFRIVWRDTSDDSAWRAAAGGITLFGGAIAVLVAGLHGVVW